MIEGGTLGLVSDQVACQIDDRGSKTVGENLDFKIVQLQAEIKRLEASKETLAPLLQMRIRDIREAMTY